MEEAPKINVQEVVEALMERIASLELEIAVLKTVLNSKQDSDRPEPEEPSGNEPGLYL